MKISAPTGIDKFDLHDASYSVSDIQDDGGKTNNLSIIIYINKIENRVTFEIKTEYYIKFLTPKTMKLHGSTKSKITKDKYGENVPSLEITEVVLVHYYIFNNNYQQDSMENTGNPSIIIYINKIENRITFQIKTGYYLKLLTPESMKLHGSTKSKITKDENGENVPYLEITEIVLIHCHIVNNIYQQDWKFLYPFVPNKLLGQLLNISPKMLYFQKLLTQNFHALKYGLQIKIVNR